jgi:hypothetical protein
METNESNFKLYGKVEGKGLEGSNKSVFAQMREWSLA